MDNKYSSENKPAYSTGVNMTKKILFPVIIIIYCFTIKSIAQENLLKSGPMVGYSTMKEVALWVQTTQTAEVEFVYYPENNDSDRNRTQKVRTVKQRAYTALLVADNVEPGIKYRYELYINGVEIDRDYPLTFQTQKLWQWREDPPKFKFAAGSCAYFNETAYDRPGEPYGSGYEIFKSIHEKSPDFMVWLGDNTYLREADWNSRTGILHRYTHDRSIKELQPLLGSTHNYAVWDDHDYGPNNSNRSWWNKETTFEAFKMFWANPVYNITGKGGITSYFEWGDCAFFLLDNRWFRSPENREHNERVVFGNEQIDWLIDALTTSNAPFKFIVAGGQILNPYAKWENYSTYPEEMSSLLSEIKSEAIEGVIFLTGDRHLTELTKMEREGTYPLYDFTISPLTSGAFTGDPEPNYMRVGGTLVKERNFAVFELNGQRTNRILKCTVYDSSGNEIWSYSLNANDLK